MTNRKKLIECFVSLLDSNIALMHYYKTTTSDKNAIATFNKSIRLSKKAKEEIYHIKHDDILLSLFNNLTNGTQIFFSTIAPVLLSKETVQYWDKSEDGYKEFLDVEKKLQENKEKQLKEAQEKQAERIKNQEIIEKAKAEGKKVEFMFDPATKKTKLVIVENKNEVN